MDNTAVTCENLTLLAGIAAACSEIQRTLSEHLASTSSAQYKADIEKDIVTLENLKLITAAIRADIESGTLGASSELLLRIAANDFNKKLAQIPEKKTLRAKVSADLKEVHRNILKMSPVNHL